MTGGDPDENPVDDAQRGLELPSPLDLSRLAAPAMELSELQRIRQQKVDAFRERGVEPYPPRATRTGSVAQAMDRFARIEPTLSDGG